MPSKCILFTLPWVSLISCFAANLDLYKQLNVPNARSQSYLTKTLMKSDSDWNPSDKSAVLLE